MRKCGGGGVLITVAMLVNERSQRLSKSVFAVGFPALTTNQKRHRYTEEGQREEGNADACAARYRFVYQEKERKKNL